TQTRRLRSLVYAILKLPTVSPVSNANETCCGEQPCKRAGKFNVLRKLVIKKIRFFSSFGSFGPFVSEVC
ncbi:unnamed protein product, partial [Ixodes pacificus]